MWVSHMPKYSSCPHYATSLTSSWLSEFSHPHPMVNFPFFLLICWYKEPTMTSGSCSFNFSGKFREHSPCWRSLDTQSLNMCGWEANVLQGGHSQLWECGDSHFQALMTRSLYLVGYSTISSPRANFKLQLHP